MTINPISSNLIDILSTDSRITALREVAGVTDSDFGSVLAETFATAVQEDRADKTSAIELLTGESDDLAGLLLDAQRAELSLNLALQVRNKLMDAYDEILRTQV